MSNELEECLKHLHHPKVDKSAPLKCYQQITFSDKPALGKVRKTAEHFNVLNKLMGNKIQLLDIKIDAYLDGKLFVPFKVEELIRRSSGRIVMIPIESESNNFYALVYDKSRKTLELFRLPGSKMDPELYTAEKKMVKLFEDKFKLPVMQFYQALRHGPREGTRDYETWPAWLAYKRLQKPGMDREIVANYALEEVVRETKEYMNFVKAFLD